MIRCVASLLAAALIAAPAARADCFDWSAAGRVDQGTLRGLPPGPIGWRVGLSPAGGIHQATSVEVTWIAQDGQAWRQTLFEEIQDGRPSLRVRRGRLELRVTYCERGGGCRGVTLPYAWHHATRRFAGVGQTARESLAAACGSVPEPAASPAQPARP